MTLQLHHIGIVVKEISTAASTYVQRYGYEVKTPIIHDATQTAYVQFLKLPSDFVFLELVAPDSPKSKLSNALSKGGGLNHLCYAADDIERDLDQLRRDGMF